jgi:DNA-binding transcriptional ArsR family regulator
MRRFDKMLWWLIGGTRGGKNRLRIIMKLEEEPMNANNLSEALDLDYKTIQHHIELMEKHNVITAMGEGYGKNYFLTEQMEENMDKLEEIKQKAGVEI